ncbi:hypothetical protein BJ742DRAFT_850597 [Cladochytrium replicatum]|nr:hypothetical protein BJ742DRAFT_850597 [Cladochytrium replicatum]
MRNNPPPKPILPPAIAEIFLYIAMALIEPALLLSSSLASICLASFYLAMIPVVAISSVFDRVGVVTSLIGRTFSQIFAIILLRIVQRFTIACVEQSSHTGQARVQCLDAASTCRSVSESTLGKSDTAATLPTA